MDLRSSVFVYFTGSLSILSDTDKTIYRSDLGSCFYFWGVSTIFITEHRCN